MVRAETKEGTERGLVKVPKINGCPRGWKSHLLQVLHSLIFFSVLDLASDFLLILLNILNKHCPLS